MRARFATARDGPVRRYFNRKIWSGNSYTPFDDAYWARGAIRDRHPGEFACLTLGFLPPRRNQPYPDGDGEDEVAVLDSLFEQFNASEKTAYRLLATPRMAMPAKPPSMPSCTGSSVISKYSRGSHRRPGWSASTWLGMETATGLYRQFFDFLLGQAAVFRHYLDGKPETRKMVLHIHCGEGTEGVRRQPVAVRLLPAQRQRAGRFLRSALRLCLEVLRQHHPPGQARLRERENLQERDKAPSASPAFSTNCFRQQPDRLRPTARRFDITSGTTQALVAYYARTNVVNLCQALASATPTATATTAACWRAICSACASAMPTTTATIWPKQVPRAVLRHQPGKQFHYRRLRPLRLAAGMAA